MSALVLIVEDEPGVREGLVGAVERLGYVAAAAASLAEARRELAARSPDCVLLDIRLRDGDGLDLLREIRAGEQHDVPVIVATAYGDSERTIRAMRDGAFDYLTKPFDFPALLATVERAVKQRALAQALTIPPPPPARSGLVGTSTAMLAIWKLIGRAAASSDAPVLITGETGTGKELVARAIHDYSARAPAPFVAVNLAALPPTLLESELFGHERGAFTGAAQRRFGRIEAAGAGTLFLDEIGDVDAALQTKLLRVLADGRYERVGGDEAQTAKARIVSATNKPVRPGDAGSVLRDDLYYRLAVIEIEVPPLRARRSDIPLLVAHALSATAARAVSEETMAYLLAYRWPGNVRELIHVIQRAAALCAGEIIDVTNLPDAVREPSERVAGAGDVRDEADEGVTLKEAVAALEKRLIVRALERAQGNRSEAARQLGIGRPQLYAKIEEYGIGSDDES
ncbi:MAG: Response regulator of zinc sigma-54-dependent two-component system [Myxococcales bacterium]|nr:Response regulator of zinc sigma-54-dependent two-component system [Myxococcales bacterium]